MAVLAMGVRLCETLKKNDNRAAHARTTHVHLKLTIRNPRSYPKMASGITMDEALKQATAAGFPPSGSGR